MNFKRLFKRVWKPIGNIILAVILILTTVYFGKCYISDGKNLSFTPEDVYILFLFGVGIIVVCSILIYLVIKIERLEKALLEVFEEISEIEDNNIQFSRITQELILGLFCKFGVDSSEKKV